MDTFAIIELTFLVLLLITLVTFVYYFILYSTIFGDARDIYSIISFSSMMLMLISKIVLRSSAILLIKSEDFDLYEFLVDKA